MFQKSGEKGPETTTPLIPLFQKTLIADHVDWHRRKLHAYTWATARTSDAKDHATNRGQGTCLLWQNPFQSSRAPSLAWWGSNSTPHRRITASTAGRDLPCIWCDSRVHHRHDWLAITAWPTGFAACMSSCRRGASRVETERIVLYATSRHGKDSPGSSQLSSAADATAMLPALCT